MKAVTYRGVCEPPGLDRLMVEGPRRLPSINQTGAQAFDA